MKTARFDFKVVAGKIDPAKAQTLVESRLIEICQASKQIRSAQYAAPANPGASRQSVHATGTGDELRVEVDLDMLEGAFGKMTAVWGMWIEGLLTREFAEECEIRLNWGSPGFAEMVAYVESNKEPSNNGSGLQKWILAALVVLILVLAVPIYGLWRMKVRAEQQVERFVTAIENVKNDVARQGDRLDALYGIVKATGSNAWEKVQGEFSDWMAADSSGD